MIKMIVISFKKNKNEKNISYNNKEEGNKKIIKTKSFFSSKK